MDRNHIDIAFPLLKKVESFQKHHKLRFDKFNYFLPLSTVHALTNVFLIDWHNVITIIQFWKPIILNALSCLTLRQIILEAEFQQNFQAKEGPQMLRKVDSKT